LYCEIETNNRYIYARVNDFFSLSFSLSFQKYRRELFNKYDTNKKGVIEFNEMVRQILPKDYPSKTWTTLRGEEMAAEEYKRLVDGKKNATKAQFKPNMTLVASRGNTPRQMNTSRSNRGSGSGRKVPATSRGSPSGSRPVSRALAARLNSVERMNTARGTARDSARRK
jgi:hypothetical protein